MPTCEFHAVNDHRLGGLEEQVAELNVRTRQLELRPIDAEKLADEIDGHDARLTALETAETTREERMKANYSLKGILAQQIGPIIVALTMLLGQHYWPSSKPEAAAPPAKETPHADH